MVPEGRATLPNTFATSAFGSLSEIDWLPTTKKAAHANYTMSAVEELARLPGYSDDGLTAVVPIRAVNFTSEPTAIWQRQLQDVSLREGGGSACVTGQPPATDSRAGSRRNRCRSI